MLNMKKEYKLGFWVYIVWCLLIYISVSFYTGSLSPFNWNKDQLEISIIIGPIIGLMIGLSIIQDDSTNENNFGM